MNAPIVRLYVLVLALFATVVGFTSYWAIFDADELRERPDNRRSLIEAQKIPRGTITTVDGTEVAVSVPQGSGNQRIFTRNYPQGELFGHPLGYSFVEFGQTEIERSENDVLIGRDNEFTSIIEDLEGQVEEGSDLTLTLDAEAQRIAQQGIQSAISIPGTGGALVAIEPDTGAVRAMVSEPGYDPNRVPDQFKQLRTDKSTPLVNRPTQSRYPPGSTMKAVTATAALDSGEFDTSTVLNADSPKQISGVPLENAGGESFGDIDMTTALTNSVNTYWAQVGEQLGSDTMLEYMDRYGFGSDPPADYPDQEMISSGVIQDGKPLDASASIDIGRVAIGQERLLTTPLQMAMVAATVANGGNEMRPQFVQSVTDPDGRTTDELQPEVASTVMSEETAAQLGEMMTNVTQEGTAAGLTVEGVDEFAGKTGTAEVLGGDCPDNRGWFISFAPTQDPQIAIAAVIECMAGFGGETAGPVATDVMGALLQQGE